MIANIFTQNCLGMITTIRKTFPQHCCVWQGMNNFVM